MTETQTEQLLDLLDTIAEGLTGGQPYTITGAADWPIAAFIVAGMAALIVMMWRDLRSAVKENRVDNKNDLEHHKIENEKSHDALWNALKDCQHDCCPRSKVEK